MFVRLNVASMDTKGRMHVFLSLVSQLQAQYFTASVPIEFQFSCSLMILSFQPRMVMKQQWELYGVKGTSHQAFVHFWPPLGRTYGRVQLVPASLLFAQPMLPSKSMRQILLRITETILILLSGDNLVLCQNSQSIFVKDSFHESLINHKKFPLSMLDSIFPPASVNISITPKHFPVPIFCILLKKSLVATTGLPGVNPISPFHVLPKISLVDFFFGVLVAKNSRAIAFPSFELSSVGITVSPEVLPEPMELTHFEISFVNIPIRILQYALATFLVILEKALVLFALRITQYTIAFHLIVFPLPIVVDAFGSLPSTRSMLFALLPFPLISIPILIGKGAISMQQVSLI